MDSFQKTWTQASLFFYDLFYAKFNDDNHGDSSHKVFQCYPISDDAQLSFPWLMFFHLTVLLLVANWGYRQLVVVPMGKVVLQNSAGKDGRVRHSSVTKLAQAHMEFLSYASFACMGAVIIPRENWFMDTQSISIAGNHTFSTYWWTNQPDNHVLSSTLQFFYVLYCARYASQFISVFLEPKRSDFLEMQVHHAVTCALVLLSFQKGFVKVGLVIMLLMDIADPFLHFGKQFVYVRDVCLTSGKHARAKACGNIADACFGLFMTSFFVTRILIYPYVVYSAVHDFLTVYLATFYKIEGVRSIQDYKIILNEYPSSSLLMLALLTVLLVLQVFWFSLILKVFVKVLKGHDVDDDRSDCESESNKKTK